MDASESLGGVIIMAHGVIDIKRDAAEDPLAKAETGPWFESLMVNLSTRFINLPADAIDSAIEDAQRQMCEAFCLDRSTLWQRSPVPGKLLLTHVHQRDDWPLLTPPLGSVAVTNGDSLPGSPNVPRAYLQMEAKAVFPWIFQQLQRGETVTIARLDDLPSEASRDKEALQGYGTRSNVSIPLWIGPKWLGCLTFASSRTERVWSADTVKRFELVAHLFANALARKASDQSLHEKEARVQAILDTAVEGIITIDDKGIIESANIAATRVFGYPASELVGQNIRILMPPPVCDAHACYVAHYLQTREAKVIGMGREVLGRRKDGTTFPLELAVSETVLADRRIFTGIVRDITQRKEAEHSLRESEMRFRIVADSAPIFIWMAGLDKRCTFVNKSWLDFRGRTLQQELGEGWTEGLHPQDLPACWQTYAESFEARRPFIMQYRLRRHDGVYRWVSDNRVPRFDAEDHFAGYIGSCMDITDRIEAEEAARDLSARLINAQEEERARLARELHDDFTQRLARMAIDLGRLQHASAVPAAMTDLVRGVREGLVRLSEDVHAISYELHPAVLVDLGLDAALKVECENLSKREAVAVDVKFRDLPDAIPRNLAICLFRIAQEALRNAVRHGRATRIELSLRGIEGGLQLAVRDNGLGFDATLHRKRPGLGLSSMVERVRLVGGELDVESEPGHGTSIVTWVPLSEWKL
jgi:PAS domain S-box-containing protein